MSDSRNDSPAIVLSLESRHQSLGRCVWTEVLAIASVGTLIFFAPVAAGIRSALMLTLLLVAGARWLVGEKGHRRAHEDSIRVDAQGIWRDGRQGPGLRRSSFSGEATCIARWDDAFGVIVFCNPPMKRAIFAFTSPARTRLVAVSVSGAADADGARRCFEHGVIATDADLDEALGERRRGLSGASAGRLHTEILRRAPQAMGRILLPDASGGTVTLDADRLRASEKAFELRDPIEWRSFLFHEGEQGNPSALSNLVLYHATSVRQGSTEAVFVCPLPGDASSWGIRGTDPPPPRELRVAIDRLFMMALRKALERVHRLSRAGSPPRGHSSRAART